MNRKKQFLTTSCSVVILFLILFLPATIAASSEPPVPAFLTPSGYQTGEEINAARPEDIAADIQQSEETAAVSQQSADSAAVSQQSAETASDTQQSALPASDPQQSADSASVQQQPMDSASVPPQSVDSASVPPQSADYASVPQQSMDSASDPQQSMDSASDPQQSMGTAADLQQSEDVSAGMQQSEDAETDEDTAKEEQAIKLEKLIRRIKRAEGSLYTHDLFDSSAYEGTWVSLTGHESSPGYKIYLPSGWYIHAAYTKDRCYQLSYESESAEGNLDLAVFCFFPKGDAAGRALTRMKPLAALYQTYGNEKAWSEKITLSGFTGHACYYWDKEDFTFLFLGNNVPGEALLVSLSGNIPTKKIFEKIEVLLSSIRGIERTDKLVWTSGDCLIGSKTAAQGEGNVLRLVLPLPSPTPTPTPLPTRPATPTPLPTPTPIPVPDFVSAYTAPYVETYAGTEPSAQSSNAPDTSGQPVMPDNTAVQPAANVTSVPQQPAANTGSSTDPASAPSGNDAPENQTADPSYDDLFLFDSFTSEGDSGIYGDAAPVESEMPLDFDNYSVGSEDQNPYDAPYEEQNYDDYDPFAEW